MKTIFLRKMLTLCSLLVVLSSIAPHLRAGSINDTVWTKQIRQDISALRYSPDGKLIALSTADSVVLLNAVDGSILKAFPGNVIRTTAFSADSRTLIYFNRDGSTVHRYDIESGNQLSSFPLLGAIRLGWVNYTPDGNYMITDIVPDPNNPPPDPVLGLGWAVMDTRTGEVRQRKVYPIKEKYLGASINKVFLDPTGDTAIVEVNRSYGDGQGHWTYTSDIIVYNVATGDSIGSYSLKGNPFQSPDGRHIALLSDKVTVVATTTGEKVGEVSINSSSVLSISVSNDGKYIGFSRYLSERAMEIWDVSAKRIIWDYAKAAMGVVLAPDIHYFIAQYTNALVLYRMGTVNVVTPENTKASIVYPNPSNGEITLRYNLQTEGEVFYSVSSVQGGMMSQQSLGVQESGEHIIELPTKELLSGVYILRLQTPDGNQTYSFTLTK